VDYRTLEQPHLVLREGHALHVDVRLGDRTHVLRTYGAQELRVARYLFLTPGLSYLGASGTPVAAGLETRTPWVHSVDAHLGARWQLKRGSKDSVSFNLDAFNVFSFRHQPPRQVRLGLRYTNL
jgi:hypothetical protein